MPRRPYVSINLRKSERELLSYMYLNKIDRSICHLPLLSYIYSLSRSLSLVYIAWEKERQRESGVAPRPRTKGSRRCSPRPGRHQLKFRGLENDARPPHALSLSLYRRLGERQRELGGVGGGGSLPQGSSIPHFSAPARSLARSLLLSCRLSIGPGRCTRAPVAPDDLCPSSRFASERHGWYRAPRVYRYRYTSTPPPHLPLHPQEDLPGRESGIIWKEKRSRTTVRALRARLMRLPRIYIYTIYTCTFTHTRKRDQFFFFPDAGMLYWGLNFELHLCIECLSNGYLTGAWVFCYLPLSSYSFLLNFNYYIYLHDRDSKILEKIIHSVKFNKYLHLLIREKICLPNSN